MRRGNEGEGNLADPLTAGRSCEGRVLPVAPCEEHLHDAARAADEKKKRRREFSLISWIQVESWEERERATSLAARQESVIV